MRVAVRTTVVAIGAPGGKQLPRSLPRRPEVHHQSGTSLPPSGP